MALPKFDTLGMAKKLEEKVKFGRTEAENLTEILAEVMQSSELATKNDLKEVETALRNDIAEVEAKIDKVETALKNDLKEVKTELESKIDKVEIGLKSVNERLDLMKIMMVATFTSSFAGLMAIITAMIKFIK